MNARDARTASVLVAPLLLAACGGDDDPLAHGPDPAAALATLIDNHGEPMPAVPAAVPADPGRRSRGAHSALRAQAERLDDALPGGTVWVDLDCCGSSTDVAVDAGQAVRRMLALPDDAPVFVAGRDLHAAVSVAQRMAASRLTRVFVVTD